MSRGSRDWAQIDPGTRRSILARVGRRARLISTPTRRRGCWLRACVCASRLTSCYRLRTVRRRSCRGGRSVRRVRRGRSPWCRAPDPSESRGEHNVRQWPRLKEKEREERKKKQRKKQLAISHLFAAETRPAAHCSPSQAAPCSVRLPIELTVVDVDALQLQIGVTMVGSGGVDSVLVADHLP